MSDCVLYETYLRDLIERKGKDGCVIIPNQIVYGIAEYIEQSRDKISVVRCKDCKYGFMTKNGYNEDSVMCCNEHSPASHEVGYVVSVNWYCHEGIPKEDGRG